MGNKPMLLVILSLIFLALSGCAKSKPELTVEPETVIELEGPVNIRNPVEVYCIGLGYEFTTRKRKIDKQFQTQIPIEPTSDTLEGPQPGIPVIPDYYEWVVCAFPDGNECEEEEFRSGRCGQEYTYCVQQGYTLEPGVHSATCVFTDGSSCPELEFFNGSCGPDTNQKTEVSSKGSIEIQCAEFAEYQHITAEIEAVVSDDFTITLCSNASTGFQWSEQADISNQDLIDQISHGFQGPPEEDQPPPPGAAGNEIWAFRALNEGNSSISLEYSQDWEGGDKATWTFVLNVLVK